MNSKMDWKFKVWMTCLVLAALFVLYMLSMEAMKDSGQYFGNWLFQEVNADFR